MSKICTVILEDVFILKALCPSSLKYYVKVIEIFCMLGFRHNAGSCHLAGCTQEVPWASYGPTAAISLCSLCEVCT